MVYRTCTEKRWLVPATERARHGERRNGNGNILPQLPARMRFSSRLPNQQTSDDLHVETITRHFLPMLHQSAVVVHDKARPPPSVYHGFCTPPCTSNCWHHPPR